jgi:hypothetical protein
MSAIPAIQYPSPSWVIPDWRRVQQVHPKSSQIGVDFSDSASIGVDFRGFPSRPFSSFVVKVLPSDLGDVARCRDPGDQYPTPPWVIPDWRRFERVSSQFIPDWRALERSVSIWRRVPNHCSPLLVPVSRLTAAPFPLSRPNSTQSLGSFWLKANGQELEASFCQRSSAHWPYHGVLYRILFAFVKKKTQAWCPGTWVSW